MSLIEVARGASVFHCSVASDYTTRSRRAPRSQTCGRLNCRREDADACRDGGLVPCIMRIDAAMQKGLTLELRSVMRDDDFVGLCVEVDDALISGYGIIKIQLLYISSRQL